MLWLLVAAACAPAFVSLIDDLRALDRRRGQVQPARTVDGPNYHLCSDGVMRLDDNRYRVDDDGYVVRRDDA